MVKVPDTFTLDRKIPCCGMEFLFHGAEVKAMFFESLRAAKVRTALKRILAKVKQQHFNGLEVTAIVARHFLGVPYVPVSAHSQPHAMQLHLDSAETRQTFEDAAEWANG